MVLPSAFKLTGRQATVRINGQGFGTAGDRLNAGGPVAQWDWVRDADGEELFSRPRDTILIVRYAQTEIVGWDGVADNEAPVELVVDYGGNVGLVTSPAVIVPRAGLAFHLSMPAGRAFVIPREGALSNIPVGDTEISMLGQALPGRPTLNRQTFVRALAAAASSGDQVPNYATRVRIATPGGIAELAFFDGGGNQLGVVTSVYNDSGPSSGPFPIPTNAVSWTVTNGAAFATNVGLEFEGAL